MDKPLSLPPLEAERLIKLILDQGVVEPSYHCQTKSMPKRNVTMPQLLHALKTGKIIREPEWDDKYNNWKYRVEGVDTDGDNLIAVTVILEQELTLKIVTVF